jgi:four helix bundle protein
VNSCTLDVYQVAVRFLPLAASIAGSLPSRYTGLADQLRRASISISLNIAEGSGKSSGPDQRRFYAMARGSAMECAAILDASVALNLVEACQNDLAEQLPGRLVKMLSKMCRVSSTSGEG